MDKLQLQESCFENIKTLCTNYKKDSKARKTEDYLTKRMASLEAQWLDFDERHKILLREIADKNITYFTDNIFEKTKSLYETTMSDMRVLLQQSTREVKFDISGLVNEDSSETTRTLLVKQENNFKAIDRALSKIDLKKTIEKWELEDHLSILKSKWELIEKYHWDIESSLKGESSERYYATFVEIEDKYDEMKKMLNSRIWSTGHYERSTPRIEVPEFSGSYTQWNSFKDLFLETIHNNPMINKAQKMQHLKTRLRGEAERLVQHLNISAENYSSCWEILLQRYDNTRLQFTSYVNTLLNLPTIQQPDAHNLKRMHDVINECLNGLSNIQVDTASWDPLIVHLMTLKLDSNTLNEYVKELPNHRDLPNLHDFLYFLESKFMAYESLKTAKKEPIKPTTNFASPRTFNKNFQRKTNTYQHPKRYDHSKVYHATYGQCPLCEENHVLMQCTRFIEMDTAQRANIVAKLHVCKNCLFSHGNKECLSTKKCKECNSNHHTLLHNSNVNKPSENKTNYKKYSSQRPTSSTSQTLQQQQSSNHLQGDDLEVLLPTVQLNVLSADGTYVTLRALLDQGSQVNLITQNAAQLLRLPRQHLNATVTGVGSVTGSCKGQLQLTCKSIHSDYSLNVQALIMNKLTNNLPNSTFRRGDWSHLENLKLADPQYNVANPIELLLGADIYSEVILDGVLKGSQLQSPIAQQTKLGWILCGKLKTYNCHVTLIDLKELTKFWEHEDINPGKDDASADDQCEAYYSQTVQRASDGKYVVKMPFVTDFEKKLGNSRSVAVSQYLQLEKRLERNEKLKKMYKDFIKEYIELNHMKPATGLQPTRPQCFLPHHAVIKEGSSTTKLRTVFNASQKTSTGYSLNSLQEKGPNLQKEIVTLIIMWRTFKYVFTADVEKMYRCIWLAEEQQPLQKIIWRDAPEQPLQEYQLQTITYGMKSAPWLALRTLQQLANDDGHLYPDAADVLRNNFFVDDVLYGHSTLEGVLKLQKDLLTLMKGGGMNLRKWLSNDPAVLKNLEENQISTQNVFDFKSEESTKTLGLGWNPKTDTFLFNWDLQPSNERTLTKRQLLSEISKLYDPLGWLSPITVSAKLLFQKVWMNHNIGWDGILPTDIQNEWINLKLELPVIRNMKLNRWIGGTRQDIQLLGFCDASEKAYSCVVYSRVINERGTPTITLLTAKTRVAPLSQKLTLPRSELSGALLLAKLIEKVKDSLPGYNITIQAWNDSQVVLAWLQGETTKWERYVANRVTKIKLVIPAELWHYVPSQQNPADCASRGMHPKKLADFDLWWNGPEFLKQRQEQQETITCLFTTQTDVAKSESTALADKWKNNFIYELLNNRSSLTQIQRIVAWILRFVGKIRCITKQYTPYLTSIDIANANDKIISFVQKSQLSDDYKRLLKMEPVTNKSSIFKLNPYLDENNIIRVGGRLSNSSLPFETKHPVVLPHKGRFTQLLIEQAHIKMLHGGARLVLAHIRQRYWIVGGNRAVKSQLRNCVQCHRYKASQTNQLMGELPPSRVNPTRPFTNTGVDFTGHVEVKLNKGRGVRTSKGYIAIFVCMATKAVHIELVSDLSAETFISAFQRMCARRGTPKHVYSDCGTNFVGASNLLRTEFEDYQQLLSPEFFDEIAKLEVEWHFNAPAWPSGGGLWEASVKSLKIHLRRVLGDQKLTFEEFTTLLTKIEACMNSRPLCPLSEDPEEFYNYLTPGHFLTGGPTTSLPRSDYTDINNIDIRRRWQLTEHMYQQFWKNWSSDYLTQLQTRAKWNTPKANIKEGDIVLVKENNLPPGKWALGRVTQLHPGSDGYVRVTTLKTQTGTFKRPIVKLAPLPLHVNNTNDQKTNETEERGKKTQSKTKKKTGKTRLSVLFTTLFTMGLMVTSARAQTYVTAHATPAQITYIEPARPIYYDTIGKIQTIHDEWILLMYYNLTNYFGGLQRVQNYLDGISNLCEKTDPRYCKPTLEQLYHELNMINHYNSILLTPQKHLTYRKKRGLFNGGGSIANSLFGLLDQSFADKYHNDIESIQNNEKHLLSLLRNQTSIVELQNDILKTSENNINRQLNLLDNFVNQTESNLARIESEIEIAMATSYFSSESLACYLLINNLKKMQDLFFNTLTDVYKGQIDVHLITPANLMRQITEISGKLPRSLSMPVENIREDIKDLYKLMYVKARVTKTYFLFELHLPLTTNEDFKLFRAIPLPVTTKAGKIAMKLSYEYIAVDLEKSTYVSLSEGDMNSCTQIKIDNFICNKNLPVSDLHNVNAPCEAKLLGHRSASPCGIKTIVCKDTWIKLHAPNSWLTICCETCTLRAICENDIMSSHTMNSSGIVTLAQGCVLQTENLVIHAQNHYYSNVKLNYSLPSLYSHINNIVNVKHYNFNMSHLQLSEEEQKLKKVHDELKFLRAQEDHLPTTISNHDIHQYAICYTLLGVGIIILCIWALKRCGPISWLNKKPTTVEQPQQPVYEDIELQAPPPNKRQGREEKARTKASNVELRDERTGRKSTYAVVGKRDIAFKFDD